ncbi:MAG: glutamate-5-semialdehyde dehydrogenase [Actinobacteria bacterium]|nr:glutamate-5-semialdehyde dehydrogenase [Actinomycetota bacterium]
MSVVTDIGRRAKKAAFELSSLGTHMKNGALASISKELLAGVPEIMAANQIDIESSRQAGISDALLDRLALNEKRIGQAIEGIKKVIDLDDPIGEVVEGRRLHNGLMLNKVRVPIGVIGIIYEARPNVTIDASVLCLKSGNAIILRGSSNILNTNRVIVNVMRNAIAGVGLNPDTIVLLDSPDRTHANELMRCREYLDLLIPRGGNDLIQNVVNNSTVPVIETGIGNCHVYVDEYADLEMALKILINAKISRCSVCNAAESLLVHQTVADEFMPSAIDSLIKNGVEIFGCARTAAYDERVKPASEDDYYREYLALKISVKVIDSIEMAIEHINKYSSHHSDAIVTDDYRSACEFTTKVDSAAVYVNASTRFTDGFEYGLGSEIGISTQRLHARGPMGLRELTTTKFVLYGDGQVRE